MRHFQHFLTDMFWVFFFIDSKNKIKTQLKSITRDKMSKHEIGIFLGTLNINCNLLWPILVFGDILKRTIFNMAKMIIDKTARTVEILVSALFLRRIVFTLNLLFILTSTSF